MEMLVSASGHYPIQATRISCCIASLNTAHTIRVTTIIYTSHYAMIYAHLLLSLDISCCGAVLYMCHMRKSTLQETTPWLCQGHPRKQTAVAAK